MNKSQSRRTSLIIGGSGGIGADISRRLASMSHNLIIHGRSEERLELISSELTDIGAGRVESVCHELSDRKSIEELGDKLRSRQEAVDIVIVSYGPMFQGAVGDGTPEDLYRMTDMNFILPIMLYRQFAPEMNDRGWGRIIFFGGTATDSLRAYRSIPVYSAAKFGLNSIVRSAAVELAGSGVTVNALCPGYVKTEYYPENILNTLKNDGKLLEPGKISAIIEFLIREDSGAISGSIINAGGGLEW